MTDGTDLELTGGLGKVIAFRKNCFYTLLFKPAVFLRMYPTASTEHHHQHE